MKSLVDAYILYGSSWFKFWLYSQLQFQTNFYPGRQLVMVQALHSQLAMWEGDPDCVMAHWFSTA